MRKLAILIVIVLLHVVLAFAQDNMRIMESLSMNSRVLGQDIKYSIVLPEDYYAGQNSYPVVYLLHGLGDDESSWLEYGRISQAADVAVKQREIVPMIFVMPQGFRNYYVNDFAGKFLYQDMFIKELIPFIDSEYRTIADKEHRATMGFSMGGFGALILPVKNPDVFTISVPLSISVRTDQQYMTEDASEWNDQWGRLFGGVGTIGEERITEYYQQHSPFHLFAKEDLQHLKNLKLYIDNGDDEQTLCRSNEELHILLRDQNFPHDFRVRNGGHEFSYWRDALPNALHFISDAFEGKPYRGDVRQKQVCTHVSGSEMILKENYNISLPEEYNKTQRLYPVIYFIGNIDPQSQESIAGIVHSGIELGSFPPLILVFLKTYEEGLVNRIIPSVEKEYKIRSGYRFRALVGFDMGGAMALRYALVPETFTSCAVFNAPIDGDGLRKAVTENKKAFSRTWYFIGITDNNINYKSNGLAHIFLRDEDIYHEYRVYNDDGENGADINGLTEALNFTQLKIHR